MLTGTNEYERYRVPLGKKNDSVDEEDLDPCAEARKIMNELAMRAILEKREQAVQEKVEGGEKPKKWGLFQAITETLANDTIGQWNAIMKVRRMDYLNAFMKEYPDFLRTMDTDQVILMYQTSQNAIKKTKKKEKDFLTKAADILETELDRRERGE